MRRAEGRDPPAEGGTLPGQAIKPRARFGVTADGEGYSAMPAHSDKQGAAGACSGGFGFHLLAAWLDRR